MNKKADDIMISLIDVYKKYGNEKIFEKFNMSLKKNSINAILGPSGTGKTTLLNIISGIEDIDSGEVIYNGNNISYIFQEDRLIPWLSVYDNIAFVLKSKYSKKNIKNIVDKYLKLVKLQNHRDKYPRELSGGMKRRVAIARAFAYESDLLLMDEPFKGIDMELKKDIIDEFLNIWNYDRRTVVLVTHDIKEAKYMTDKIYFLEKNN
ncbi:MULTISPECIES: ATP-binding cassette domain-containing protein [Clostridium]|uniref:Nitrate ABC transporter, ATP-binding protein n=1 Tax=Clostridium novyi (strain NT) TaxID=386415 RepID=A0Q1A5_CLONN|nr:MULTISPECIES: ATP-binding cassette domain-containing protein [Clostridium]ABK61982.1 nitrate ABC transporter, ATP-binding protein [Clostridium novyi NT]